MSLSSVKAFFADLQLDIPILETEANTATVALAAQAHGVEPGRIAKTLAFKLADDRAVLLVARGDARIDNGKFKTALGKGKMLSNSYGVPTKYASHCNRSSCLRVVDLDLPIWHFKFQVSMSFDSFFVRAGYKKPIHTYPAHCVICFKLNPCKPCDTC